jgi:hypothetical protein
VHESIKVTQMPVIRAVSAAYRKIRCRSCRIWGCSNPHPVHACDREGRLLPLRRRCKHSTGNDRAPERHAGWRQHLPNPMITQDGTREPDLRSSGNNCCATQKVLRKQTAQGANEAGVAQFVVQRLWESLPVPLCVTFHYKALAAATTFPASANPHLHQIK